MSRVCYLLFFFLVIQGYIVQGFFEHCHSKKCQNLELQQELQEISFMPTTEDELNRLCPPIMQTLQCGIKHIQECTGQDIVELSTSTDKTAAAIGHLAVTMGNLIIDICTPGSEMRENYLSSIVCFKNLVLDNELQMKCFEEGQEVFSTYEKSKALLGEEVSEEVQENEYWCMTSAYTLACFASELHDTCGEVARKTFVDTLRRFKSLKWNECTEANIRTLKTEFLDFLELEEERRDIFFSVFDTKRRRK